MSNDGNVKKGREVLRRNLEKSKKYKSSFDLFKIPVESLYCEALQEIGKQESYIEELTALVEDLRREITQLKSTHLLEKPERLAISKEIKREELYTNQKAKIKELRGTIKEQRIARDELITRIVSYERTIEDLKRQLGERSI